MDTTTTFPGFGKQLAAILRSLDTDVTLEPVWTFNQTSGETHLHITWPKVKLPDRQQYDKATSKRKSPSTRKRDKLRRKEWLARKRCGSWNKKPKTPGPQHTVSENKQEPTPSNPHVESPKHTVPRKKKRKEVCVRNQAKLQSAVDSESSSESSSDSDAEYEYYVAPGHTVVSREHYESDSACGKYEAEELQPEAHFVDADDVSVSSDGQCAAPSVGVERAVRRSTRRRQQPRHLQYDGPGQQSLWSQPIMASTPALSVQKHGVMALMQQHMQMQTLVFEQNAELLRLLISRSTHTLGECSSQGK